MKKEIKDKLDIDVRRSKREKTLMPFVIGFGFLGFILVFVLLPFFPASSANIQGVAVKLTAIQTEEGNFPRMIVKLKNDITIRASMPRMLTFTKGAKVNVLKKKSIMGIYNYQVVGYATTRKPES